ncbi:hypothetical protein [Natronorubrum halophilum]|uniref:hypothetical protein n=1 Tax=Natronorubrum halophilum TaxID=1702106 RepID=UPI0013CF3A97|nr:hypothetical protein [Natronorubrum halophilum]
MHPTVRAERNSTVASVRGVVAEYAILVCPLLFGALLIALALALDLLGKGVEAGVTGAMGVIIGAIAVVVYATLWLLGRYGH